ncbi:MAG: Fic/DOC family N-terminal domain-containing protein, partial [Gemmatimonadota bacterium]
MIVDDFGPNRTGRLTPISTIDGADHAFVPDPLPPDWEWPEDQWPLLLDAHRALASLDGAGRHLPNPRLLLHPLQQREAQESSSLEGTHTDPQQQMLFQLDPDFPESASDQVNAFREVFN